MNAIADTIQGGCRCGAVRYEAMGEPNKVAYCHCESCRMATAAPVAVNAMYEEDRFRFTKGNPRTYESSPGVLRGFCPVCGTPLTWAGIWHKKRFVFFYVVTLDNAHSLKPDRHAFSCHKVSWFDVADELPRYPGTSPSGVIK